MAVVRNITPDALRLFSPDAPPANPGDDITVSDARFMGRAWPKSTWEVIEPPEGFIDIGGDAYLYVLPELEAGPGDELPDLPPGAYAPDAQPIPDVEESAS